METMIYIMTGWVAGLLMVAIMSNVVGRIRTQALVKAANKVRTRTPRQ